MATDTQQKSKRQSHLERLQAKYPDRSFEDDEEIFAATGEDYDRYEQDLDRYRQTERQLSDMFAADPRSAQFLTDMHRGQDPVLGLVRNFGLEIKDVLDDPEMQEKIAAANKEYVERVARSRELEEQYNANLDASLEALRQFQQEQGLSDEEVDRVFDALLQVIQDGVLGKFAPETLLMMLKALRHDSDVALAGEQGQIAGRNARITEKLRKDRLGDGTRPLGGANNSAGPSRPSRSIFEEAAEAV